jgi:RNA polymerase sigma-70 factor, ECF subfamily
MEHVTPRDRSARVGAGDVQAFDELITEHAASLRAFIALRSPSAVLIDEVAQETFVFAFHHISEFKEGTNFGAWLRAIAFNMLRREIQRFSREQVNRTRYYEEWLSTMDTGREPEESRHDLLLALQGCLSKLNETQRQMLTLRYRESWSAERIAERLRQTPGWVRTNMCRIRKALRVCIESKTEGQALQ